MKDSRRKQMEALVARQKSATMEELRQAFGVSMNTVRSDVALPGADRGGREDLWRRAGGAAPAGSSVHAAHGAAL